MFAQDPVSIKAIIPDGKAVLLLQKGDGTWELPGGRLDPDESISVCLQREVYEETGLACTPETLVSLVNLRRPDLPSLVVATYACTAIAANGLRLSDEHVSYAFVPYPELHGMVMLSCYREAIEDWRRGDFGTA